MLSHETSGKDQVNHLLFNVHSKQLPSYNGGNQVKTIDIKSVLVAPADSQVILYRLLAASRPVRTWR